MSGLDLSRYFLPYQIEDILCTRRLVLWEKSVRIGATYGHGFRAVRNRMLGKGNYLHTSVNERIAKAFMEQVKEFNKVYDAVVRSRSSVTASEPSEYSFYNELTDRQESAFECHYSNGCKIKVFSSNPSALRGEGGEVGVDELTSHLQPEEMLKAAGSRAMWGDPVVIWTSHRGEDSAFARMIREERAKGQASRWHIRSTSLDDALDQGLLDKINQVKGTKMTREEFVLDTKAMVGGGEAFLEECMLQPRKGGDSAVNFAFITASRHDYRYLLTELRDEHDIARVMLELKQTCETTMAGDLGYDVARTGHLSSINLLRSEALNKKRLVGTVLMHKQPFEVQRKMMRAVLESYKGVKGLGDSTGLGMDTCEQLEREFGQGRFKGVNFGTMKMELGTGMVRAFEAGEIILPAGGKNDLVSYDVQCIRIHRLPSGRPQFYEVSNPLDKRSHADIAWSLALAIQSATEVQMAKVFIE